MSRLAISTLLIGCSQFVIGWSIESTAAVDLAAAEAKPESAMTHTESARVVLRDQEHGRTLQTFCLGPDGRVFALIAPAPYYGVDDGSNKHSVGGEIRVLDALGSERSKWPVAFTPQRLGAAPDGEIYVGGSGRLARYSSEGKLLAEIDSPHLAELTKNPEALREQAEAQRKSSIESYASQLKLFDEQIKRLEKQVQDEQAPDEGKKPSGHNTSTKPSAESDEITTAFIVFSSEGEPVANPTSRQQLENMKRIRKNYAEMLETQEKKTVDDVIQEITARLRRIHGITIAGEDLFVATAITKGYGFAVWRMTRDFQDAKQIVTGLSGCCGQIDIQARGGELFVAENSRHRVVRYNRDGKQSASWGKRDRDGEGAGFGGCCNPMNLCFTKDAGILTAESEGLVKCFSADGTYERTVAGAKVGGGCKNVAIAVSPDGKHLYFYDQQGSQIIILDRTDSADPKPQAKPDQVGRR